MISSSSSSSSNDDQNSFMNRLKTGISNGIIEAGSNLKKFTSNLQSNKMQKSSTNMNIFNENSKNFESCTNFLPNSYSESDIMRLNIHQTKQIYEHENDYDLEFCRNNYGTIRNSTFLEEIKEERNNKSFEQEINELEEDFLEKKEKNSNLVFEPKLNSKTSSPKKKKKKILNSSLPFKCTHCNLSFATFIGMRIHQGNKHSKKKKFSKNTEKCGKRNLEAKELDKNEEIKSKSKNELEPSIKDILNGSYKNLRNLLDEKEKYDFYLK
ncbi:unnamed protein product [Brachionus calyciflorus]|uniref:C2H2-type domain-containing protein n=1 Tax=Brachionus calyciflorus TaxID=104777 RepID=A0A814JNU6_9BILA|nr:unnamed protein product [Brachionus calyciflorus]